MLHFQHNCYTGEMIESDGFHTVKPFWDYVRLMLFNAVQEENRISQFKINERRGGAEHRFPSQNVNFQKVLHISTQLRTGMPIQTTESNLLLLKPLLNFLQGVT